MMNTIAGDVAGVMRVELSRSGLKHLDACAPINIALSAELLDSNGEVCGRAMRQARESGTRSSDELVWRVQVGGTLVSRVWSGSPMGCGCGDSALSAAIRAVEDLRERSAQLYRQSHRIGSMLR